MDYQELLQRANLNDNDILNVYQYGSRCYEITHPASDWDFIVVTANKPGEQFSDNKINVSFQTPEEFQQRLDAHEISQLECHFLDERFVWKKTRYFPFKLVLPKLRHALSAKASKSFVKAMKKLTVEADFDAFLGKKSLYHSFRIIEFGIQIATFGRIVDYHICHQLYKDIMYNYGTDWKPLFDAYKQAHNELMSRFRALAPKE